MPPDSVNSLKQIVLLAAVSALGLLLVFPGLLLGTSIPVSVDFRMSDLLDVGLPLQSYAARTLVSGRLPLWYPGCFGGLPLSAIPEAVPYYPFTTPFYALFSTTRACAWILTFHLLLAGIGAGMLVGRWGAAMPGRALTALAVGLGLWLPNHFRQTNMMYAAAWVPCVWLALERWLERPGVRNAAVLGLAGGMMALAGHAQILHHTIIVLALWTAGRFVLARGFPWRQSVRPDATQGDEGSGEDVDERNKGPFRAVGSLAVAALLAIAIGGPHLFPTAAMARLGKRRELMAERKAGYSRGRPKFLLTLINPHAFRPSVPGKAARGRVHVGEAQYIGLVPLLFALGAFGIGWRERGSRRRIWTLLTLVLVASLWLSCAQFWRPTAWTLRLVPGLDYFRYPQRHLWFTSLSLALAAGLGLTWFLDGLGRRFGGRSRRPLVLLAVGIPLIAAVDLWTNVRPYCPIAPPGGLLEEPESGRLLKSKGARPGAFGERTAIYGDLSPAAVKALLASEQQSGSLQPFVELRRLLFHQHAGLWDWQSVSGYVGVVPDWTRRGIHDQHRAGLYVLLDPSQNKKYEEATLDRWAKWAGLLGARWVLSPTPIDHRSLAAVGTLRGQTIDCHIYENAEWAGPAWICRRGVEMSDEKDLVPYLFFESSDFRSEVVAAATLPKADPVTSPPAATRGEFTRVESARPEEIRVDCRLAARGFVVLSLGYHPQWRRRIDGGGWQRPLRVNLCQTAVFVEPGAHTIELRYDGRLETATLAPAFLALVACGIILLPRRRR